MLGLIPPPARGLHLLRSNPNKTKFGDQDVVGIQKVRQELVPQPLKASPTLNNPLERTGRGVLLDFASPLFSKHVSSYSFHPSADIIPHRGKILKPIPEYGYFAPGFLHHRQTFAFPTPRFPQILMSPEAVDRSLPEWTGFSIGQ